MRTSESGVRQNIANTGDPSSLPWASATSGRFDRESRRRARVAWRLVVVFAQVAALVLLPGVASQAAAVEAILVETRDLSALTPPSPDPAGIVYLGGGKLLVSDSEVNEMPALYAGVNLWEMTLDGEVTDTGDTTSFSDEPTGLALDPSDGTLFISDDDDDKIYKIKPGPDGVYGTGDDGEPTSINTRSFGARDPEGVAFAADSGHLFVANGATPSSSSDAVKVFQFKKNGDFVNKFELKPHGVVDPEGIVYDPVRKTLLVIDHKTDTVFEFSKGGVLKRVIDVSAPNPKTPAGVELAPASDGSGCCNLYIVDRGVDNNSDPDENDGMLYEFSYAAPDSPPAVTISEPADGSSKSGTITFSASATDPEDGDLPGSSIAWRSNLDGAFGTGSSVSTSLTVGTHKVTAWATDSNGMVGSKTITVNVLNKLPKVTIESPIHRDYFPSGEDIEFSATASDPEDGNLTSSIVWKRKGFGTIGTGGTITEALPDGSHLIKAIVIDSNGGKSVDKVRTFVGDGAYKFRIPIAHRRDDVEERLSNNRMIRFSSDLDLVKDRGRKQAVGLRFELPVPAGATILGARIQFEADKFRRKKTKLAIRAHRSADAPVFRKAKGNLTDRKLTPRSDRVIWKLPRSKPWRAGRHGKWQRTPNLKSVVQWIIDNRAAWGTYNHLAFVIKGKGSRIARSFEAGSPPELRIRWAFR